MFVNRTRGVVWATSGVLALVGCTDPAQKTDLRPAGPPEVLSVLVMNDAAGGLAEGSTFCKTGDTFRPGLVNTPDGVGHQLCPDDLTMGVNELADANPSNWYARVMFDELLDPSIEDLVPILDDTGADTGTKAGTLANTQPFTLQCQSVNGNAMVDIPYDGYYSPAGNKITWPVGPSLVIIPNEPARVATQSECQLTLKDNIKDEDGNPVPADQRGPYKFKIAPIALVAADTSPADGDSIDPLFGGVDVTFNTAVDPTSIDATTFNWMPDPGNDTVTQESDTEFLFGGDLQVNGDYTFTIPQGAKIKDQCGKETTFGAPSVDDTTQVEFMTNPLTFNGITPFDTQANAKAKDGIHLRFNQFMDPATLAASEFSITPAVPNVVVTSDTAVTGDLVIKGDFAPATDYVFTLKAGATINDCPGGEATCVTSATGGTFTNTADQVVHYHTAATALTSTTPADNGEFDKSAAADPLDVTLSFNTLMVPSSLATTEWSISPAVAMSLATVATKSSSITFESNNPIPAGDYTFTLKAGATITDVAGGTYTQAADKVIHFTVVDPPPTTTPSACF